MSHLEIYKEKNMEKLRELFETKIKILAEKKTKDGDTMQILAPWIVTGKMNKNKRLYPLALIQREIAKAQAKIKAGALISSADHPAVHTSLADASHIIRKLELDSAGKGWMEASILPTIKGKNVMTIIKAGGQLGISARGAGTVDPSGKVNDDYELLGIDFCTSPSEPEAVFDKSNVCESVEFEEENQHHHEKIVFEDGSGLDEGEIAKEMKRRADLEEAVVNLLSDSFHKAVADDMWYGSFEEYKAKYGKGLREMMGLDEPSEEIAQAERSLTEQQIRDRTYGYYLEAVKAGEKCTFSEWKEKFPQLVEQAPKPKEPFKSRTTWEEIQLSGFKGTMAEYEKQCPDISIIRPKPIQEKIVETIEQESKRIYYELKKDNPNSDIKLATVQRMLEKEAIVKSDKRLRKKALAIISRECDGSISNEKLEKMVEQEIKNLKEEQAERKRKELVAYRCLLEE